MRFRRFLAGFLTVCLLVLTVPALEVTAQAAAKYYITVDLTNQIVTVYDNGNTTNSGIVRQMICSSGKAGSRTPSGTFTLPSKKYSAERTEWYYFPKYSCYAKWATRITGSILFHSVLYTSSKAGPTKSSVDALGSPASHGCVRLRVEDSKWIAQNCPAGTKVKVYSSGKSNAALRKKLLSKGFSRAEQTYESFLGIAETTPPAPATDPTPTPAPAVPKISLAKNSKGAQVKQLQTRLKTMGFFNDKIDSKFRSSTVTAVKAFEAACGLKQTGKVNNDIWDRLFADNAPTGTVVPLKQGMQCPPVATLQQALVTLKMYEGPVDGVYSAATTEAVRRYQSGFGLAVNGSASSDVQKKIIARANSVRQQFGDSDYQLVSTTAEVQMGEVKVRSSLLLRQKASTKSKSLARMKNKTKIKVLSVNGKWLNVQYGGKTGYVLKKYVKLYMGTETTTTYEPVPAPEPVQEPEVLLAEGENEVMLTMAMAAPAEMMMSMMAVAPEPELLQQPETPAEPAPETPAEPAPETPTESVPETPAEPAPETQAEPVAQQPEAPKPRYAVVQRDGARLYAQPAVDEQAVVAEVALDTVLDIVEVGEGWIAVSYNDGVAYVPAEDVTLLEKLPEPVEAPLTLSAPADAQPEPQPEPQQESQPAETPTEGQGSESGLEIVPEPESQPQQLQEQQPEPEPVNPPEGEAVEQQGE